jgi:SdpI/YhfL family protein
MEIYGYLLMASDFVLILGGATMYWFSPRLKRNWVLGYSSPRSMINDHTWQAGNRYAGVMLAVLALILMLLHVSLWQGIKENDFAQTISTASTLFLPLIVLYLTEKHLARVFRN